MKNRIIKLKIMVGILSIFGIAPIYANSVRHMAWNKQFISIEMPIGKEKMITVCSKDSTPDHCNSVSFRAYFPQDMISTGTLSRVVANGVLYLNANSKFNNKLITLKLNNEQGNEIFIRLSSTKSANQDEVQILMPQTQVNQSVSNQLNTQHTETHDIADIIWWVSQRLYGEQQYLTQPNWIYRVPMHTKHFIPLYRGAIVSSMPLASWRAGDYYVTAVLMRNVLNNQSIKLGESLMRGDWIDISFVRLSSMDSSILTPAHTITDSTTALLVSTEPFEQVLQAG